MSDTNAARLAYVKEVTENVIPTNPIFTRFRYTGAPDLAQAPRTAESNEIIDDGQLSDLSLVAKDIGGSVNIELSYNAFSSFLEAAIRGTYQARTTKTQAANGLNVTGAAVFACTTDTSGIAVGDLIATEGYVNAANNGLFQVSTVTSNTSYTVTLVGGGAPNLVIETATSACLLRNVGRNYASGVSIGAPSGGLSTLTGVGTNFTSMGWEVGDWIKLFGYATAANNGYVRINTITSATVIVVDRLPTGFAAEGGTATNCVFVGERLKNATDKTTFTLQELFTDLGTAPNNTRALFSGMNVNTMQLSVDAEQIVTGQISFLGQSASYATAPIAGETFVEAPKFTPMNASSDVARIGEGGSSLDTTNLPQKFSININNNLAKRAAIGRVGGAGVRRGQFSVSGELDMYFDDKTKLDKVIANTETSLDLVLTDTSSHASIFDLPRVKFSQGSAPVSGRNADVLANLQYVALKDKTLLYTIKKMRFWRVA